MSAVLEARGLVKNFGENQIIRGLNLSVLEGERHAVIGPNGAGKSTLFNLVTGYLRPTSGDAHILEHAQRREDRRDLEGTGDACAVHHVRRHSADLLATQQHIAAGRP